MYLLDNFVCLCFNFTDPSILNVWKSFQSGLLHHLKMYFVENTLGVTLKGPQVSGSKLYSFLFHDGAFNSDWVSSEA